MKEFILWSAKHTEKNSQFKKTTGSLSSVYFFVCGVKQKVTFSVKCLEDPFVPMLCHSFTFAIPLLL